MPFADHRTARFADAGMYDSNRNGRASINRLNTGSTPATAIVALVIHWMTEPVRGLGIAVPVFVPVLVTAIIDGNHRARPVAYHRYSVGIPKKSMTWWDTSRSEGSSAIGMLKKLPISVASSKKIAALELTPRLS